MRQTIFADAVNFHVPPPTLSLSCPLLLPLAVAGVAVGVFVVASAVAAATANFFGRDLSLVAKRQPKTRPARPTVCFEQTRGI